MSERPILFSGPMVRAILEGRKTQTRRVIKPQPPQGWQLSEIYAQRSEHLKPHLIFRANHPTGCAGNGFSPAPGKIIPARYAVSDRLWVRETWATDFKENILYRATDESPSPMGPYGAKIIVDGVPSIWRPSIFMPREYSRITLAITRIRVERLQQITETDAVAEGIEPAVFDSSHINQHLQGGSLVIDRFARLWDSINGKKVPWESDPYVWVLEFKRIKP